MKKQQQNNFFCEKIVKGKGVTKIELNCWLQIQYEFNQIEYQRYISNFQKSIKNEIFKLKTQYEDQYEYFVDINIRDSPSKTAFLSSEVSLFKDNLICQLPSYPKTLKNLIENYPNISVFYNDKKRKSKSA